MKIFAISDLHMSAADPKPMNIFGSNWNDYLQKITLDWNEKVSEDDVVIIAGDISWAMNYSEAALDFEFFKNLKGKKIFVRGNHDYWWKGVSRIREKVPENCYLLQNDAVKFGNVVFCGSRGWNVPGSPDFSKEDEKIYMRETERLRLAFFAAKKLQKEGDKIICITHFPPFNVKRESNKFLELMCQNGVSAAVYGHLHGKDARADKKVYLSGIDFYLTSCDLVENKLVEINLD